MSSPWLVPFAAVLLLYVVTAAVSFASGQRLLHELRDRFPRHYQAEGEPSYLSFAAWGKGFWRPLSAANFFYLRRYLTLDDAEFAARAERVRKWHVTARYALYALVAMMLSITYLGS